MQLKCPRSNSRILRHTGICGLADEAGSKKVNKNGTK